MTKKRTLCEILLGVALLLGIILIPNGTALGRNRDKDCRKRIEHQEQKLHEAIKHHGERSRQAAKARDELRDARAKCGDNHHRNH